MEEIDRTIAEFKLQNQIDDYLHKNIYPDFSVKRKRIAHDNKPNKRSDFTTRNYMDTTAPLVKLNTSDFARFQNIAKKIENIENRIIGEMNTINNIRSENIINEHNHTNEPNHSNQPNHSNENICPICIEPIGNKSYFMAKCNHSICGNCCYHNFTKNEHTALLCPMCRTHIL